MAEQINIEETIESTESAVKKAAPKVKTAAKKAKTATKKATTSAKKTVKKKTATAKKSAKKAAPDFAARAKESGRNAFLAGLGFYGKAFDQAQDQFDNLQDQLEDRRQKADKVYKELVKRGTKVEKDAKSAVDNIELPQLDLESLTDRKKLEAQLDKAKARFAELKNSVNFKKAA